MFNHVMCSGLLFVLAFWITVAIGIEVWSERRGKRKRQP
jgi:type IV secretory pathway TrbD component